MKPETGENVKSQARKPDKRSPSGRRIEGFFADGSRGKTLIECEVAAVIFRQGAVANSICFIRSGYVYLTVVSPIGKPAVVRVLGPGDLVGEGCLAAGGERRSATAYALSHCSLWCLEKDVALELLVGKPLMARLLLSHSLETASNLEESLANQIFYSSEKRLAHVLLCLANRRWARENQVLPRLSQELLAAMVGTTRSRISFFLTSFRKQKFIEHKGQGPLKIHSSLRAVLFPDDKMLAIEKICSSPQPARLKKRLTG